MTMANSWKYEIISATLTTAVRNVDDRVRSLKSYPNRSINPPACTGVTDLRADASGR